VTSLRTSIRAALLMFAAIAFAPRVARAEPKCEYACSVEFNCSSTGLSCDPDDRACTSNATSKGLEVKCEQACDTGKRFVYCPSDTGRSDDSRYVWVLLVLAGAFAAGGMAIAYFVLRKKEA
jgi:hypothetical protein